jgi:midasin
LQDLLDKYLLGSNNMFAGAHKNMPLATREMEELFSQNCQLVDLLREDMQVMRQQEISMRSVKEVLISRLEELLDKVCAVTYVNSNANSLPVFGLFLFYV